MATLREEIAEIEHIQWAFWTEYMLDNLNDKNIARWREQIKTDYKDLSEKEKDSDRVWGDKVLELFDAHIHSKLFPKEAKK